MRISTSQIFDAGALNIQRNQGELFKLQNQLSTGRRVLTPADDPVAAAQALVVSQSKAVTGQHVANQDNATSQLGLVDSQLGSLTDLLQNVRDRVVQAGNTTLNNSDRQSIATELDARLSEMLGIANSDNGSGDFLFSGYQGATRPFALTATGSVGYSGDDGERLLQVSSSRQMGVSVAGSDVFMNARNGNGTFVTATGGNGAGNNQGSATIDAGSVLDPQKWAAAVNTLPAGQGLEIRFAPNVATGAMEYTIFDGTASTGALPYTPGQSIPLVTATPEDFGSQVVLQGNPANGDTFTINPSSSQSLFQTVQNLIGILRSPVGATSYSTTQFTNELGGQLTNVDQALNNVSRVQSTVGTKMRELESLGNAATDLDLQFSATLSQLQDLDYAKAITDFTKQQVNLEAAQKSFVQISSLSLFNLL